VHNAIHDDDVTLTVEQASPASASPGDHAIVDVIRARMQSESASVVVLPILTKGATDCRFVRAVGVPCYGYVPVRLSSDELDAFHGKDERVRTDELKRGLSRLTDITHSLASTP
jgi:acetylornithine deacetylase/succinyl-diaminopimelate desuccinylase-like protein